MHFYGTKYAVGMILAHGSTGRLPNFVKVLQIALIKGSLIFVVESMTAWSNEHLRRFILEKTHKLKAIEPADLTDTFPLTDYLLGGKKKKIITLKHFITVD